ncbi:MAG: cytochrome c [Anaerolineae bacterium]|nr:cytochrome c [Anaerolineae bacterium]
MLATHGPVLDLRPVENAPPEALTRIIGPDFDDLFGSTVFGHDLDGDGLEDILAAAALWRGSAGVGGLAQGGGDGPGNTRYNAGDTFVIYGSDNLRGRIIDLQAWLMPDGTPADERLTVVYGAEGADVMGEEIIVGDLNGDGLNDLIVGSLAAPSRNNARIDGGEAWVVYGREDLRGRMVDLAVPGAGVPIYASHPDSKGGDTMLVVDMDQDGIGDLLYGTPNADAVDQARYARPNAGVLVIIYGAAGGLPTTEGIIDLLEPPADLRLDYWLGADQYDMSAYGMAVGDIDGDGFEDIALNGMNGDGPGNGRTDAGEIYIVSGRHFRDHTQQVTAAPLPLIPPPQVTATTSASPTPLVNLSGIEVDLDLGRTLYNESCAGCHGLNGEGLHGIGVMLIGSEYLALPLPDVLAFVRQGRTADHPDSRMGRAMPASGGRPELSDAEMLSILSYMQTLDD